MSTALAKIIDEQAKRFDDVSCQAPGINFEAEKGYALQILSGNDYTGKIALANPDSLRAAVTNISAIGISLNPALRQAYLVPRDGRVCLDISYMGLLHIAIESGAIEWGQAVIVRQNDVFEMQEIGTKPIHKYNPFGADRGDIVGCYAVVKVPTADPTRPDFLTTAIPIGKIYDVRNRSEAWKRGQKGPWKTDEEEMIKKTVIKNAFKYWPKKQENKRLAEAIQYMNTDGGEGITFGSTGAGNDPTNVTPASAEQQAAVTARLTDMGKAFTDLSPFFIARFKQTIASVDELTEEQATAVLAFIQRRAA